MLMGWAVGSPSPWGPLGMRKISQSPVCVYLPIAIYICLWLMVGHWFYLPGIASIIAGGFLTWHALAPQAVRAQK